MGGNIMSGLETAAILLGISLLIVAITRASPVVGGVAVAIVLWNYYAGLYIRPWVNDKYNVHNENIEHAYMLEYQRKGTSKYSHEKLH